MTFLAACMFGHHDWITREYSGRGLATGYRKCLYCPAEQTRLYDYRKKLLVWLDGKFVQDDIEEDQTAYVFAGSQASFQDTINAVKRELPHTKFMWMRDPKDWELVSKIRSPLVFYPSDWKDNALTDDYRFLLLITKGYI